MCWTIKLHEAEHDIFEMYELSVIYDILYEKKTDKQKQQIWKQQM